MSSAGWFWLGWWAATMFALAVFVVATLMRERHERPTTTKRG